jgi:hypothetical protein
MTSHITRDFYECFKKLPETVKKTAKKNYRLWKNNAAHPGLNFKKVHSIKPVYSVRVGINYRALGIFVNEENIVWFWIGSHSDYNNLINDL